jgi:eukaryotic-like serine/threonine-protein kinase
MSDETLLAALAENFIGKIQSGQSPDPEEYALRHPQLAQRIRELFPTLLLLESSARSHKTAANTASQLELAPDSVFGSYRIEREIGRGGMGIVYEAIQVRVQKRVALKVLASKSPQDAGQYERFYREARISAKLSHPNIVPVLDVGQVGGAAYFAMQYIEGKGLDRVLRLMTPSQQPPDAPALIFGSRSYRVSADGVKTVGERNGIAEAAGRIRAGVPAQFNDYLRWVADIGIQAASGLAYAHGNKLIHRDIKPSNLLLGRKGALWIADFGLARSIEDPALTMSGLLLGTPRYMSPEQAEAAKCKVDHRSDIYSLGATLYELLTCRPAFDGRTSPEILLSILMRDPEPPRKLNPAIPVDLETIVMKAMAKRPDDRYQAAQELANDLQRWLRIQPIKARTRGLVARAKGWRNQKTNRAMAAGILAAVLIAGGVWGYTIYARKQSGNQSINNFPPRQESQVGNLSEIRHAPESFYPKELELTPVEPVLPPQFEPQKSNFVNSNRANEPAETQHSATGAPSGSARASAPPADKQAGSSDGKSSLANISKAEQEMK